MKLQVKNMGMKIFFVLIILLSVFWIQVHALPFNQPSLGSNKNPEYISNFIILEEGGSYQCRFSLKDVDYAYTTAAGTVNIKIIDSDEKVLYEDTFQIQKSDFGTYELVFTGEEFIAYVWSFEETSIDKGFSPGKAILSFTSGGWYWEIENDWVTIPEYSEEELAELLEDEYKKTRVVIGETVAKPPFEINLETVGEFTYRPYSWSEEEIYFRIDISVRNYGSSSSYFWASSFVIIDDLWNQYDPTYYGTLESGEMHPGVIRKGYLLFPTINTDATIIRIIYTQSGYPEDTIYEFSLNMDAIKPKEPSQITCSISDTSIVIENSITISGVITPIASGVPVTLAFSKPDSSSMILSVETNSRGMYSFEFQPDSIGSWVVNANWLGDNQYSGSISETKVFSVTEKLSSSISCMISLESVYQGNQVEISGIITPTKEYEDVMLHIRNPEGIITDILLETNNVGRYSYAFSPSIIGSWLVNVSWMGDSEYLAARNENDFTVLELPPTGSLTVTVYDLNSLPITGASVSSISQPFTQESFEGYTNSDGVYSISSLFVGSYKIQIAKSGYDDLSQNIIIEENEVTPLEIHLSKKVGSIKLYVKDTSAKPCEGASIASISQPSGQSTLSGECNNDGYVLFDDLKPGNYDFLASFSGYESSQTTMTVIAGERSEKTIILEIESSKPSGEDTSKNGGIPGFPVEGMIIGIFVAMILLHFSMRSRSS